MKRHSIRACETCTGFHCWCENCEILLSWPGRGRGEPAPKDWYASDCPRRR